MKLLIGSAMIFFGTLVVAALLELGWPAGLQVVIANDSPAARHAATQVLASTQGGGRGAVVLRAGR